MYVVVTHLIVHVCISLNKLGIYMYMYMYVMLYAHTDIPLQSILHYFSFCAQFFPDRFVRREILGFELYCSNQPQGCTWEGTVATLEVYTCTYNYNLDSKTVYVVCISLVYVHVCIVLSLYMYLHVFYACEGKN